MQKEIALLSKLVAIKSVTPKDGGCLQLIEDRLCQVGFISEYFNTSKVSNLWLIYGQGEPITTFIGHVDVVPTGPLDKWKNPPFKPIIKNNHLWGRGACDMKGGIAAIVEACADYVVQNHNHRGTVSMIITSDEEGPAIEGTNLVLNELSKRKQKFTYGLVAEPTCAKQFGDTIKNGRRGSLSAKLTIIGKQGHVAYPDKAINSVHIFAKALTELTTTKWDDGNQDFPPTTFQISNIHAGTGVENVIPGEMEVDFNFRHGNVQTVENLKKRFEMILKKHNLNYQIIWHLGSNPYLTSKSNKNNLIDTLSKIIFSETGINPKLDTGGGVSDGRFLAQYCDQVIEFGTLNQTIHQINEKVNIDDVIKLKNIYQKLLTKIHSSQ